MTTEKFFGFLTLNRNENENSYLGALLVVDVMSRPIEFRVTFPVKPTAIQRPLYGDVLEPYIGVELCGRQLIESVDHKLDLVVVNQEFLLEIRKDINCPVIYAQHAGEVIEISSIESIKPPGKKTQINSTSGRFQPIIISSSPREPEDSISAKEMIERLFEDTDLLEPFERIENALEVLVSQDERFK
jgi:hypothetical protein